MKDTLFKMCASQVHMYFERGKKIHTLKKQKKKVPVDDETFKILDEMFKKDDINTRKTHHVKLNKILLVSIY